MVGKSSHEVLILLHGLAANRFTMSRLAWAGRRHPYRTLNWGYPSVWKSIEQHATAVANRICDLQSRLSPWRIHFVGHSMGGIVARRALQLCQPKCLGRLVMLGPPNAGSHVARRLAPSLGHVCPPLLELSDDALSYVNRLAAPSELEVGIIAAAEDRVVPRPNTFLTSQRDHIVLPGHHGMLPWRQDTVRQTFHFLQHGSFERNAETSSSLKVATTSTESVFSVEE